ncbi:MAG: ribokinase [bacterium]
MSRNAILVIGSANMDLVVTTQRFPQPGETVFGNKFGVYPGGKGANQAVAAAKLGGHVHFFGKMGNDEWRERLSASMESDGVNLEHLLIDPEASTGMALITVDLLGQNEIVVVPGSNMNLTPLDVDGKREIFGPMKLVLMQLEIPWETVLQSARAARAHGAIVILNPAPARALPKDSLALIDYLTPNENETEVLTGIAVIDETSARQAAQRLLAQGVRNVIITMGEKGALLVNNAGAELFPTKKAQAVDTTAAGDAFNGALAFALANDKPVDEAIRFANSVAAYSVTRMGAQSSMPTIQELHAFLS